jgi:hypothetical protein
MNATALYALLVLWLTQAIWREHSQQQKRTEELTRVNTFGRIVTAATNAAQLTDMASALPLLVVLVAACALAHLVAGTHAAAPAAAAPACERSLNHLAPALGHKCVCPAGP